jgi:RimJ/RimL family protein N-acetyltransferase
MESGAGETDALRDSVRDPLLIDLPERIGTERLTLRPPRAGDGPAVNEAIVESIEALQRWMPWASPTPTVEQTEAWCRNSHADFIRRKQIPLLMFLRGTNTFVGSSGMPRLDWRVPRFEIGYWVRRRFEGRGYVTEAVAALTQLAFERLAANRVEIFTDARNERSWRVAERLGFELEGVLRNDERAPDGRLRDTRVYAKTSLE